MYAIETKNLTKYYGKSRGIIDLNIKVHKGEIFGFIGPNGAGKSTTIRILLNFIFPTGGNASVLGLDCIKESKRIKEEIGYIPAEVSYYDDMKAKDLLKYSASFYSKDTEERAKELIELFELDTEKKIEALSFGNKKKVAIIQAILHRPKLLILDEPTSGLDPLMQRKFFDLLINENKNGTTIFFSSHILSEVQRLCNRVAIIKEGKILKVEEMEKLRRRKFKKVRIVSKKPFGDYYLNLPGVMNMRTDNNLLEFLYNGNINDLMKILREQELENLWLEEPELEEIFIHYYEKGSDEK